MEGQKPWPDFPRNQDFAEGKGLEPKVKMSDLGDVLNKLVQLKRTADWSQGAEPLAAVGYGGLKAKPPAAGDFS